MSVTPTMITTAIGAARSPYSIAVTPDSESIESQPATFVANLRIPCPFVPEYRYNQWY